MPDNGRLPELTRDDDPADWAIKLRLALFETQRAAARHYNMTSGTLSRYESGDITPPLPYLASLSRLLLEQSDPLTIPPADRAARQEHLLTQIRNLVRWHPEQYERQFPFRDWAELCHAADRYEGQHPSKAAAPEEPSPTAPPPVLPPAPALPAPDPATTSAATGTAPTVGTLRQILEHRFDDPSLDAFCLDHYPAVYDQFSGGMRRDAKTTLLLNYCRQHDSLTRLQQLLSE